jgi:hypothetical protein
MSLGADMLVESGQATEEDVLAFYKNLKSVNFIDNLDVIPGVKGVVMSYSLNESPGPDKESLFVKTEDLPGMIIERAVKLREYGRQMVDTALKEGVAERARDLFLLTGELMMVEIAYYRIVSNPRSQGGSKAAELLKAVVNFCVNQGRVLWTEDLPFQIWEMVSKYVESEDKADTNADVDVDAFDFGRKFSVFDQQTLVDIVLKARRAAGWWVYDGSKHEFRYLNRMGEWPAMFKQWQNYLATKDVKDGPQCQRPDQAANYGDTVHTRGRFAGKTDLSDHRAEDIMKEGP